jgi:hypothetical protein
MALNRLPLAQLDEEEAGVVGRLRHDGETQAGQRQGTATTIGLAHASSAVRSRFLHFSMVQNSPALSDTREVFEDSHRPAYQDQTFDTARYREQARVSSERIANRIDKPDWVTVGCLLDPVQEQVDVIGRD